MKKLILFAFTLIFFQFSDATEATVPCGPNQYAVSAHFRKAYHRSDGTFVSATNVRASCKDRDQSYNYWADKMTSVRPKSWPNEKEISKKWTEEERNRVLDSLQEIPSELWPRKAVTISRMKNSKDAANPASNDIIDIVLYDAAFGKSVNLTRILIHELAHIFYAGMTSDQQFRYGESAGWTGKPDRNGKIIIYGRKSGFVAEDGKISFDEDFSNNLEYFVFDPDKLRKVSPQIFEWFQKNYSEKMRLVRKKQ